MLRSLPVAAQNKGTVTLSFPFPKFARLPAKAIANSPGPISSAVCTNQTPMLLKQLNPLKGVNEMARTPASSTPKKSTEEIVAEQIAKALEAERIKNQPPALKSGTCLACGDIVVPSNLYGALSESGVCSSCSTQGRPPSLDWVLSRKLGFPKGVLAMSDLASALIRFNHLGRDYNPNDLLNLDANTLAEYYDSIRAAGWAIMARPKTQAEKAAASAVQYDHQNRNELRIKKSKLDIAEKQIAKLMIEVSSLTDDISAIENELVQAES